MQLLILSLLHDIMNKTIKNILVTGTALASSIAMPFAVSAQTTTAVAKIHNFVGKHDFRNMVKPAAAGKVTAINGSSISITTKENKTVTVDASATSYADIKLGDLIMVEGTVNGDSVKATSIHDVGAIPERPQGLVGKVTAIDGNTITLSHPDGQVITVDASAIGVTNVKVGDRIAVEGKVSISAAAIHQVGDFGMLRGQKHEQPKHNR
jgi:preprotein translocase subunit YajC